MASGAQTLRALIQAIVAEAAGEAPWGVGVVAAVNGDGTLRVTYFNSTLDHLHRLKAYSAPAVNDLVLLLHGDEQTIVVDAIV